MHEKDRKITSIFIISSVLIGLLISVPTIRQVEGGAGQPPIEHIEVASTDVSGEIAPPPCNEQCEIKLYIQDVFGDKADEAFKILSCENKQLDPRAIHYNTNGSNDTGIFQINSIHGYTQEYLADFRNNIDVAKNIYDRQGWNPWACSRRVF